MAEETITLRLVAQDLMSGNVSKAISGLDQLAKKGGLVGSVVQGVGQSFGQMLNPVGLVTGAIGAVTDVMGDSISAASDQEEALSKVTVVFGDQADEIKEWADQSVESMGMSETSALSAAGTLGNLFDSLKIAGDESADMSREVVELASDLASFNNTAGGTDEVLGALQAGLLGETEPMRRFGSNLSAARVESYLLAKGIARSKSEITEAMKVQARYALILEDTVNAQGDYARTSDGLANSQRTLAGRFQNLSASIGQLLEGPARALVGFLDDVVSSFLPANDAIQRATDYVNAYGKAAQGATEEAAKLPEQLEAEAVAAFRREWEDYLQVNSDIIKGADDLGRTWEYVNRVQVGFARAVGMTADQVAVLAARVVANEGDFEDLVAVMRSFATSGMDVAKSARRWGANLDEMGSDLHHLHVGVNTTFGGFPKTVRHAVMDMKNAIKQGKAGIIEQFRDLAWQSKHPFAQKNYEEWLREREATATRKMKQAARQGRPGIVEQYRQLILDIQNELRGLPGYAAGIAQRVLAAMDPIERAGFTWTGDMDYAYPNAGGGGGGGGGRHRDRNRGGRGDGRGGSGNGGGNGENGRGWRGGPGGAGANITVLAVGSEADADRLADALGPALDRRQQRRGYSLTG